MTNKTLSALLYTALAICIVTMIIDDGYGTFDGLYTISGLMYLVFGTWAAAKLSKMEE